MIQLPLASKASILAVLKLDMTQKISRGKALQSNLPYNKKNAKYYEDICIKSEAEIETLQKEVAEIRNTIQEIENAAKAA